jgi:hypothetical protein
MALGLASASSSFAAVETCPRPQNLLSPAPTASTPQAVSSTRSGCQSLRWWASFDLGPETLDGDTRSAKRAKLPRDLAPEAEAELKPTPKALPAPIGVEGTEAMTMDRFLDRLMHAESGGQLKAKNPRSTALGPFQFINSTFLSLVRRHFGDEIAGKSEGQILALRTDLDFSRRAVAAFTNENAEYLKAQGVEVTYPGLRLAHLLGPAGAALALKAAPSTALPKVFSKAVLRANPFMTRLTVADLVRRAERELGLASTSSRSEATEGAAASGDAAPSEEAKPEAKTRPTRSHATKRLADRSAKRARAALRACKSGCGKVVATGRRKVRFAGK